jgi:purine-binding chemotaxis protein CheW
MNTEKETYVTFELGQDLFAVNVKYVLEVLDHQQITNVPKTPEHILGIINFRGEILPVVNTRVKFKLNKPIEEHKNIIIVYILEQGDHFYSVAGKADGVKDVIEIAPDEIKPVPEMGLSYDTRFVSGVIKRDEKYILIIHPEKVFSISDTEIIIQAETTNQ